MNWSPYDGVIPLELLHLLTIDAIFYLFGEILFMAGKFDSQSKGWQNYTKPIVQLDSVERYVDYRDVDRIKTLPDEDECIYIPVVYGQDDKLKIVSNPMHGYYSKPPTKATPQSPLVKASSKKNKNIGYGTGEDGHYVSLCSTVAQSSPPLKHQLASRGGRDLNAPVSRGFLRALSNDFESNKDRVMTLEPTSACRQSLRHTNLAEKNNNNDLAKKAHGVGESHFVSPRFDLGLTEREDNDELLDYCTCMCFVKGALYHYTKDSENEGHMADEPCSCAGPMSQCLPRWGCLGISALFLPCLWCYLPLKGCQKLTRPQKRDSRNSHSVQWRK